MRGQAEWVKRKRLQTGEHLGGSEGVGGSLCLRLLGLERPALPCPSSYRLVNQRLRGTRSAKLDPLFSPPRASDLRHT